jgi:N4-bis(aminopropyl)spermidine synthase
LRSCNLLFKALPNNKPPGPSARITDAARLRNFYGRDSVPRVRYVREKKRLEYGKRHDDEFFLEILE